MTLFSRNLLIAQCVIFLVTQVAMVWLNLALLPLLAVGGNAPFGYLWQWITHPLVEPPGMLLPFALAMFVAYYTYPRMEATYGRKLLVTAWLASAAMGGVLGTATALVFSRFAPSSGAFTPILGLFAFDAWTRRDGGKMRILPFVVGPSFDVTGRQLVMGLFGLAALFLLLSRGFVEFAVNVGSILGGMAVAQGRELRRTVRKQKLRVVNGGRGSGDGMLH